MHTEHLFPVPVLRFSGGGFDDARLLDVIGQRRAVDAGEARSNAGGWHSSLDLPAWPDPEMRRLVRWIVACAAEASASWRPGLGTALAPRWRVSAWANVNPPGASNNSHRHCGRNWHWASTYYVATGTAPGEAPAKLVFEGRGSGLEPADTGAPREHAVTPQAGDLWLFPSWLDHRVEANQGGGERVSIAMNLRNEGLEDARLWTHNPRLWWRVAPGVMRRWSRLTGAWDQSGAAVPPGYDVDPADRAP